MGLKKVFDPALCRSRYQTYSLEFMLVFYFMTHTFSNIFETETYFLGNMKVLLEHLYTR